MVVPILLGLALVSLVGGCCLAITKDSAGVLVVAFLLTFFGCGLVATFLNVHHIDAEYRRDVRHDLTAQQVNVLGVSARKWEVQYLVGPKYCTAHVDIFNDKYILVHETQVCR